MRKALLVVAGAGVLLWACQRARVESNELEAIVDTCSVAFGEGAYSEVLGRGVYGPLECLAEPRPPGCISNYSQSGPRFLDPWWSP